jgi:hypothetical protein
MHISNIVILAKFDIFLRPSELYCAILLIQEF